MNEIGIAPYGLAANWCEECGRPKMNRLLGILTGCPACDEVITRHRCTERPGIGSLADGEAWECPGCGSEWVPRTEEQACPDCCGACGHRVPVRVWDREPGDRVDTAPRYEPRSFIPFRDVLLPGTLPSGVKACYRMAGGSMVHVKPGCRCKP